MRRPAPNQARVVVKIGSSSLSAPSGGVEPDALARIVSHVDALWELGHPTVLVSSGAVAAGLPALGLNRRPRDVPGLQAAAAVGQGRLMELYASQFAALGRVAGQVLLTQEVLSRRSQYLHSRATLDRLLAMGVVPVVNENDSVVGEEQKLGDNDRLAAIVSHLTGAGMLILLSDTPGLFSQDPSDSDDAALITAVRHNDQVLDGLRDHYQSGLLGSGGVATKVAAARMAAWSGIPTVIASASDPDVARRAVQGGEVGTWVEPHHSGLTSRKLWIAFGLPSRGEVVVDDGAATALVEGGKSLLAAGVVGAQGAFDRGAAVQVTREGNLVAKGLVRLSAEQILKARGQHSSVAGGVVIHRDDLVVLT